MEAYTGSRNPQEITAGPCHRPHKPSLSNTSPFYFSNIRSCINHPAASTSSKFSLCFQYSYQYPVRISVSSVHATCPSSPPSLDHINNILGDMQNHQTPGKVILAVLQVLLSLNTLFSNTYPLPTFFPQCGRSGFIPLQYSYNRKNDSLLYFNLYGFLIGK
jgi:hypothetical protein